MPAALHASLMARLDRLALIARETAQVGAAIGREFSYELITAVADRSDDALIAAGLDQLVDAVNFSAEVRCRKLTTSCSSTPLCSDAAYGSLLKSRRQHLHGPHRFRC